MEKMGGGDGDGEGTMEDADEADVDEADEVGVVDEEAAEERDEVDVEQMMIGLFAFVSLSFVLPFLVFGIGTGFWYV